MKVLFHYDAGDQLRESVARFASEGLDVVCCPEGVDQPFATELANTEVLWHVLQPITAQVIERAPRLRLIQKIGVGVNTIDLEAAKAKGIAVCNMPGTNSQAVAEMSLLLMLSALRKQTRINNVCRSGQWAVDRESKETFGEICGRTVGFVGYGEIPKRLTPVLMAMGASVVYTATKAQDCPVPFLSLEELLQTADIVSLHAPLTSVTQKMINAQRIQTMKTGSILINTARGGLVDEDALYRALQCGKLSAAGLDVFYEEPVRKNNRLLSLDNVSVTPHIAWLTNETLTRSIGVAVENSMAIMKGEKLSFQIC
jgi:phosphoglycerate dehydrogenase-like enzyme